MARRKQPEAPAPAPIMSVTLPLQFPVEHEGTTYSVLTLRRMKARDALVAEDTEDEGTATARLYGKLAGVPAEVIFDLDIEDFVELGVKAAPLMGKRAQAMLAKAGLVSPGETSS